MRHPLRRALPLLVLLAVAGPPLAAMTLVMPADGVLADQASLVVEATVTATAPAPGGAATDSTLRVERLVKGVLPGGELVLRTPGGEAPNGRRLHVWGSPQVPVGSRALLFLVPRRDGTWGALHLAAGVFHEQREVGRRLALRDLAEVQVLDTEGEPAAIDRARDLDKFARWVGDRASGVRRQADYFVEGGSAGPGAMIEKFGYLGGTKQRWTEFDGAQDVAWRSHVDGQPGQADGGVQAFKNAIAAWNNDADTTIRYRYAGTTTNSNGIGPGSGVYDLLNTIIFEDPNDQADGTFTCSSPGNGSGTLAIGGTWTDSSDPIPLKIYNADIVINDGAGCWFTTLKRAEQVYGHELGHTLGLGHSNVTGALMRATAYSDERGAALAADDREAIFTLYPAAGAGKPAAPSNLVATALSASSILLSWTDNSSNETSFRLDRAGGGSFAMLATIPANTTSYQVLGLDPNTLYTFRVRAQNASGNSAFSNQASATTLAQGGPPPAPSQLTAVLGQGNDVQLFWQDNSNNEGGFRVERSSPVTGWTLLANVAPNTLGLTVTDGVADTPYSFRVRANGAGGAGSSAFSNVANVTTPGAPSTSCTAGPGTLCLGAGGRFRVEADWRAVGVGPGFGDGGAVPLTAESGTFYFFSPDNVELIVKVLDASALNQKYWVFYGALSNVEYWITVTDTATGARKTYHNEPGSECGNADTGAFASQSQALASAFSLEASEPGPAVDTAAGPCAPGTLCLLGGRFEVTATWEANGGAGAATPISLADGTSGLFWFFDASNIELVVKALDGRPVNGRYWFFYGALSDVEYDIHVRDTVTGIEKTYHHGYTPGILCGDQDTNAFLP